MIFFNFLNFDEHFCAIPYIIPVPNEGIRMQTINLDPDSAQDFGSGPEGPDTKHFEPMHKLQIIFCSS